MKRFLGSLAVLGLLSVFSATAADDLKLKLGDCKFKTGEGTPAELVGYNEGEEKIFFYAPGTGEWTVKVAAEGEYTVHIKASCDAAQNENAKFKLAVDGKAVGDEVKLTTDGEKEYQVTATLKAGELKLAITFTNDVYKEGEYDRNLYLHGVTLKKK